VLTGASAQCALTTAKPGGVTAGLGLGEAFFNSLSPSSNWGAQFANKVSIKCPTPAGAR
jgi:hypothetical protein